MEIGVQHQNTEEIIAVWQMFTYKMIRYSVGEYTFETLIIVHNM